MSFILIPNYGDDIKVNAWNWRPTLEFLKAENVITHEHCELLGANGCGAKVDAELAIRIASVINQKVAVMRPGQRILADLSVTSKPKTRVVFTPATKSGEIDASDLYSASYEWLTMFRDFCKRSGGFRVS